MTSAAGKLVLIVEDDRKTASILSLYLRNEGFETVEAHNGDDALAAFRKIRPAFVILDLMIPRLDGIEVCKQIRSESDVPIMIVSAKVEEADRLIGLSIGADDYVIKPFSPREITARVKVILRRQQHRDTSSHARLACGDLVVDTEKHKALLDGVPLALTHFEFMLLRTLMTAPGRVYSRDELLAGIYPGGAVNVLDRTVDVHIRNLRQKIEKDPARPRYIRTVRGVGYQFAED